MFVRPPLAHRVPVQTNKRCPFSRAYGLASGVLVGFLFPCAFPSLCVVNGLYTIHLCVAFHLYAESKEQKNKLIKNRLTNIENNLVTARGKEGWRAKEVQISI